MKLEDSSILYCARALVDFPVGRVSGCLDDDISRSKCEVDDVKGQLLTIQSFESRERARVQFPRPLQ